MSKVQVEIYSLVLRNEKRIASQMTHFLHVLYPIMNFEPCAFGMTLYFFYVIGIVSF